MPPGYATRHVYPKLFHEVFNEAEPDREMVMQDFRNWLKEH